MFLVAMWRVAFLVIIAVSGLVVDAIIDGQDAGNGRFPYQVSLHYCQKQSLSDSCIYGGCSATIIEKKWVLTAAHCVVEGVSDNLFFGVEAGTVELYRKDDYAQLRHVKNVIVHPSYIENERAPHDIAVLEVDPPFVFNPRIQAVALPTQGFETTGSALIAGWGAADTRFYATTDFLRWTDLNILTQKECQSKMDKVFTPEKDVYDQEGNICTASDINAFCFGDAGAGLVRNKTLVGIASWSSVFCVDPDMPGALTKVSNYVGWIRNVTGLNL